MSESRQEENSEYKKPSYKVIDGVHMPNAFSEECYRSALAYKPRPDDLFIITFPKCGTTWVQNIVNCIFRDGKPFSSGLDFFVNSPFLELTGAEGAEKMKRPGAIKLHTPFHRTPWSPEAKYICIARNPKDCCVSFYYHTKNGAGYLFADGTFNDFFENFINGQVGFGDYFETVLSWWEHRNDPNVLFLTYEELKRDTASTILKIAGFISSEYKEKLEKNPKLLQDVISHSSFNFMNEHLNKDIEEMFAIPKEEIRNNLDIPTGLRTIVESVPVELIKTYNTPTQLVRKGIVGGWRNYFLPEHNARMNQKMEEKFAGTELLEFWKDEL